jgi:hypothetical protein
VRTLLASLVLAVLLSGCKSSGPHLVVPTPPHSRYVAINPHALHALSANDVWVVGDLATTAGTPEGLILWTDDGGRRWHRAASEVHDLGNLSFTSIFFTDRLRGWIAGRRVTPEGVQRAVVFRTKDGGNHWNEVTLPARDAAAIEDIHSTATPRAATSGRPPTRRATAAASGPSRRSSKSPGRRPATGS